MNALNKIADYFKNWNGIDEDIADIQLSTEDLRYLANLNVQLGRAKSREKQIREKTIDEFRYELELLPLDDRELVKYAIGDEHSFNEYIDWFAEELKNSKLARKN